MFKGKLSKIIYKLAMFYSYVKYPEATLGSCLPWMNFLQRKEYPCLAKNVERLETKKWGVHGKNGG